MVELFNIDCMQYMKELKDHHFDIAIVDPPYGINAPNMNMGQNLSRNDGWNRGESVAVKIRKGRLNSGGGKFKNTCLNTANCNWDMAVPPDTYFKELFRVSKHQIIWGGNYFKLSPARCIICWDKMQPWKNFSQWEMAWTSFDRPAALFRYSNTGGQNKQIKIHPTEKPIALYKWLFTEFVQPGWKILDTHLGSGNSAKVANKMGFDFVGCEIDKSTFDLAILHYKKNIDLGIFNPEPVQSKLFIQ